jgi:nicotinamide riboside kinase
LELVLATGGSWLPPDDTGALSVEVWCRLLGGKDPETIRRWIRDLRMPVTVSGNQQLVEARDMRRFLPRLNDVREAPKRRTRG